jgi:hypothetical protein
MLRLVFEHARSGLSRAVLPKPGLDRLRARGSHGVTKSHEEQDQEFIDYFNRPDIDHWEIRKAMNQLAGKYESSARGKRPIFQTFMPLCSLPLIPPPLT